MLQKISQIQSWFTGARRFVPLGQDTKHSVYILQKGTLLRIICLINGERATESILDLHDGLEISWIFAMLKSYLSTIDTVGG